MPKNKLFDEESEEEDVTFQTESQYAKKYNTWREKEEIHKLEQKYGPKALASDATTDSEDETDEEPEVNEETETQFLKTLSLLKTKDPRIYDPNYQFFEEKEVKEEEKKPKAKSLTFEDSSDDDDDNDGNIFKVEKKAEILEKVPEKLKKSKTDGSPKKEAKIKDFLVGKAAHIGDDIEKELAPLKALWSDPKLNEGESFLRDYILNKRYLEEGSAGEAEDRVRDDEALEEDERRVEEQGKFERAYNFRFEEPDDEYLKRFPRTMNYIRPKDDRRARARAELRARKDEQRARKMDEIARLKALKLKEIHDKIARIKEVTGNQDLAFKETDIEGDFDPEEHDRRMRALFDEQFYGGDADSAKPVFPDLDDELEIENWDNYDPEEHREPEQPAEDAPHCEDEDFNMDADYDPKQVRTNLLEQIQETLGKKRRNRKKKSKLAELLSSEKPKFVPTMADKTYDEYMQEYYKMDCEDIIGGDLPTRFKYREVVPNDFGLTVEEILLADDRDLTQWVPLKKIVKHRPAAVERSELNTYALKAADEKLKRKLLPSLFRDLPEEPEIVVPVEEGTKKKKKKKKNKDKKDNIDQSFEDTPETDKSSKHNNVNGDHASEEIAKKKKKHKEDVVESNVELNSEVSTQDVPKKKKKKHRESDNIQNPEAVNDTSEIKTSKNYNQEDKVSNNTNLETVGITTNGQEGKKKKHKQKEAKNYNLETAETESEKQQANDIVGSAKGKKQKTGGFMVENAQNNKPSHAGKIKQENKNLKRKLNADNSNQVPIKKKKKSNFESSTKKVFNKKFNKNDKGKKTSNVKAPMNPLTNLTDERLKAYGLNPKKYRSFLKYKKY